MAKSEESSELLYEKVHHRNTVQRALDVTIVFLLLFLLSYRLLHLKNQGFELAQFLAFLCESWFTFIWGLVVNSKWNLLTYKTYPQSLRKRIEEVPRVDMFVTTADAELESPIVTLNTVLSLLAVEYPAHKLACYVSDDGCSPLTFYSLVEASEFAEFWVPFCKKYNVQTRAPFRYFSVESAELPSTSSSEFQQDWKTMKEKYVHLCGKIEQAAKQPSSLELTGDMAVFSDVERLSHPSIVKVISENTEKLANGIPHLIYISREKRRKHPHHYKAGAMNVLTRVSGLMTNAPLMLNVDCDTYASNPEVVLQAVCLLMDSRNKRDDFAFVQCPQYFYDFPENSLAVLHEYMGKGMVGMQGPMYHGSGAFHRRQVMYGLHPDRIERQDNMKEDEFVKKFGDSKKFIKSVANALEGKTDELSKLSDNIDACHQVANSGYECNTSWGDNIGWLYGSTAEDNLTSLGIHARGWRSGYCSPEPKAFLGCMPPGGPAMMTQQKRWATGLLEILFTKCNPISATLKGKLMFRQSLAYLWINTWGLRSVPELCYVVLPAYCIISNSSFLPKVHEPSIIVPVSLLVIYKVYTLTEYIRVGFSIYSWWVSICMGRIVTTSAWLFGVANVIMKLVGVSEMVFEVTQKVDLSTTTTNTTCSDEGDGDGMVFDESSFFVPGTTIVLVHMAAWATGLLGLGMSSDQRIPSAGLGEYFCSVYVMLCFLPFLQGLSKKGKRGIPSSTICKSAALAFVFVQWCRM